MIELDRSRTRPNPEGWRHRDYQEARDYAVGVFDIEHGGIPEERQRMVREMLGADKVN